MVLEVFFLQTRMCIPLGFICRRDRITGVALRCVILTMLHRNMTLVVSIGRRLLSVHDGFLWWKEEVQRGVCVIVKAMTSVAKEDVQSRYRQRQQWMRYLAVESQTARHNVNLRGAARPSLWVVWPKGLHRFALCRWM
jgi:hypothetical protein